jgi:hypothetical protein
MMRRKRRRKRKKNGNGGKELSRGSHAFFLIQNLIHCRKTGKTTRPPKFVAKVGGRGGGVEKKKLGASSHFREKEREFSFSFFFLSFSSRAKKKKRPAI